MPRQQRWAPDTCGCVVIEEIPDDGGPKVCVAVETLCPAHADLDPTPATVYDVLYGPSGENRLKNEWIRFMLLSPEYGQEETVQVIEEPPPALRDRGVAFLTPRTRTETRRRFKDGVAVGYTFEGTGAARTFLVYLEGADPTALEAFIRQHPARKRFARLTA